MKAVVVEIKDKYVSVLSNDGCVVKLKNDNYEIGQVIQMTKQNISLKKSLTMVAASAAAVIVLGVGTWAYASPYSYVSLDVNPSIEFTVNRFDRVLKVKAVNDDGEELLQVITLDNLKNKTIQNALTETVKQITEIGYFDGPEEGGIVIATSATNEKKAEELAQQLQETVEEEVTLEEEEVEVEVFSVGLERVEKARELGVTPGKLNLVEKLQASAEDPETVVIEEWLQKPVKDIMKATKENRKANPIDEADIENATANEDSNDKDQDKLTKAEEKAAKKVAKAEEKAARDEERATEKAAKTAEKAAKKAEKAAEKAAKQALMAADYNGQEAQANVTMAEEAAQEALSASKKASEEADKAARSTDKANAGKAKDAAEKAAKEADKAARKAEAEADKARMKTKKAEEKAKDKTDNNKPEEAKSKPNKPSNPKDNKGNSKSNGAKK